MFTFTPTAQDLRNHLTTVARDGSTGHCLVRCVKCSPAGTWEFDTYSYSEAWDVAMEHRDEMGQNEAMVADMTAPAAPVADFGSDFDCCTAPVVIA